MWKNREVMDDYTLHNHTPRPCRLNHTGLQFGKMGQKTTDEFSKRGHINTRDVEQGFNIACIQRERAVAGGHESSQRVLGPDLPDCDSAD